MATVRDLHTLDEFRQVVALEHAIWGLREECVPVTLFAASVPRGGVLVGAFDRDELVGFSFAFPAVAHRRLVLWSHMTGVADAHRGRGVGLALKLAQRQRARAMGIDRIDWTFDPLQADNAHFNLRRLGAIVERYEVNVYGELASPLHGSLPTDRFVVQWWIDAPHVSAALDATSPIAGRARDRRLVVANPTRIADGWTVCEADPSVPQAEAWVGIRIPPRYTAMLALAPEVALRWRLATRRLFQVLLGHGYRIVDFEREADGGGTYVLTRDAG